MVWPTVGKYRLQVATVFPDASVSTLLLSWPFTGSAFAVALEATLAMVEFSLHLLRLRVVRLRKVGLLLLCHRRGLVLSRSRW